MPAYSALSPVDVFWSGPPANPLRRACDSDTSVGFQFVGGVYVPHSSAVLFAS